MGMRQGRSVWALVLLSNRDSVFVLNTWQRVRTPMHLNPYQQ